MRFFFGYIEEKWIKRGLGTKILLDGKGILEVEGGLVFASED
jgi:hypothetical protein